ncbi:Uncharacterised protein [Pseudomonas aeruginosa]|nr:hypothetical protein KZ798_05545 [Pseudomonas aeruginosa]CRO14500.1 hypothetical protein PAERUG_E2_London_17_VIM_2_02_09_01472 [Pseudomonas aeruginosa]VFT39066.1 Uncharacterised protein [Pseudomonas aeruginosa]
MQAAQQRRTGEVGAEDAAEQRQQRRECQQQRRGLGRSDAAGRVVQFPVRIAAVQRLRTLARRRRTALQQHLGRCAGELLDQLYLAGIARQGRQGAQQPLQVDRQQQRALQALVGAAHRRGAVQQPALADLVGFGGDVLATFHPVQDIQGGEADRAGAVVVLGGLAGRVQVGIDHAVPGQQAALGGLDAGGVAALQGFEGEGAGRGGAGVGGELLQGLAQGAGLAFGPGRVQLALLRLTGAAEDAEPEQGAGGRHAQ